MRLRRFIALIATASLPLTSVSAQDAKAPKEKEKKKIKLDFTYDYDPFELHRYSRQTPRSVHLKGPIAIGEYYIPPFMDNTKGPPTRFWGTGWGASVWRDPVTGRYIQ